jgi:hypothetical protein
MKDHSESGMSVLAALQNRGVVTAADMDSVCASVPGGPAALTSLLESGDVFCDQNGNYRARNAGVMRTRAAR